MSASIFAEKELMPNYTMLCAVLGKKALLWKKIEKHLEDNYGKADTEWKFYSAKSGWIMKTILKKRNLFFLTPYQNYFRVAFVFGDKVISKIAKSSLPANIIEELLAAKKYAEGRGISIEVKSQADVKNVIQLLEIKIGN